MKEMSVVMKRFFAFSIDLILVELFIYLYCVFLFPMEIAEKPIVKFSYIFGFLLYNFIFDYFYDGYSVGKRLMRIKVVFLSNDRKIIYCFMHGIFRCLSGLFFPFFGFYYLCKKRLPQDALFNTITETSEYRA